MARLYSDLIDGSGRRYYFGLTSAPGGISNSAPATLTIFGRQAAIQELTQVFRTPATAALTLQGLLGSSQPYPNPAQSALGFQGKVPTLQLQIVITNSLPPDYTTLPDIAPTIVYIATITPTTGLVRLASLEHNVTPGGDIGFISPPVGALSLQGRAPNYPRATQPAGLAISGLVPTLISEIVIEPESGTIRLSGLATTLSTPFTWVDDDPTTVSVWIEDPRA